MPKKLLSIIVPSYNMEKFLPKCLGSLIVEPELMTLLDVLVVNDGSKDRTSAIAHEYAEKHPDAIRVIDKPNGNYGSCVNRGLAEATGKYVKVLDADDTVDVKNFAEFVRFVRDADQRGDDIDLFLSDYCVVDPEGNVTGRFPLAFPEDRALTFHDIAVHDLLTMHNVLYRTQMLRDMGYRQTEGISYTDNEWCFLPMLKVRRARYFGKDVYRYLVGRSGQTVGSASSSRSQSMYFKVLQSLTDSYLSVEKTAGEDGLRYLQQIVDRLILNMCRNCALQVPVKEAVAAFKEMDVWIKEKLPDFYARPEEFFFSSRIRFKYVRFLRNHGEGTGRLYLVLMRHVLGAIAKFAK